MIKTTRLKKELFLSPEDEAQFFNAMVEYVGDELILIDSEARIVYANDAAAQGLGLSKERLLKKRIIDFYKKKLSLETWKKEYYFPILKKKKPASFSLERVVKGGERQIIRVAVVHMRFKSQDYLLSVGHNVTHETLMRDRMEESEKQFRLLCEGAPDAILTFDLKGRVTYANPSAERLFKIPFRVSKGMHFTKYIERKYIPKALGWLRQTIKGKMHIREELEGVDHNGNIIPIEFSATPLYKDKKVDGIHLIVRDIRKRKQLESLQIESEKMKAMNQFIAGTTQEIKFPLKAVLERLQSISDIYQKKDFEYIGYHEYRDVMDAIETVRHQIKYCYDTVSRLVNINKKRMKFVEKKCDVNKVISDSVALLDEQFMQPHTRIKLRLRRNIPMAAISGMEFAEAVGNILTNAVQAMPAGGTVTIKTTFERSRNRVIVKIRDQGIGIKKEFMSQIFEPFFTTKQRGLEKSSGLGLSIVYSIVQAYNGEIFVESSLRHGTEVTVELPPYAHKD